MNLAFQWKTKTGDYQSGENLYLNRIRIASYEWDGLTPLSERQLRGNWIGYIHLPSLPKSHQELYSHKPEELKAKIEDMVEDWFKQALSGAA